MKSDVFLFADDTKIARQVKTVSDSQILQDDLDSLSNWSNNWLLEFNADKCHVLTIGKIENITHTHKYVINGEELEHVFEEKDLGVTVDFEMSFSEHICLKVKKANAIMGLIRRSFSFLDVALFRKLYTTFVRPHIEYAQVVWSPFLMKHEARQPPGKSTRTSNTPCRWSRRYGIPGTIKKAEITNTSTSKGARRHDRGMEALQYLRQVSPLRIVQAQTTYQQEAQTSTISQQSE